MKNFTGVAVATAACSALFWIGFQQGFNAGLSAHKRNERFDEMMKCLLATMDWTKKIDAAFGANREEV